MVYNFGPIFIFINVNINTRTIDNYNYVSTINTIHSPYMYIRLIYQLKHLYLPQKKFLPNPFQLASARAIYERNAQLPSGLSPRSVTSDSAPRPPYTSGCISSSRLTLPPSLTPLPGGTPQFLYFLSLSSSFHRSTPAYKRIGRLRLPFHLSHFRPVKTGRTAGSALTKPFAKYPEV